MLRTATTLLSLLTLAACSDSAKPGADTGADTDTADDSGEDTSAATVPYGPDNAWYHAPDASLVPEEPEGATWAQGTMPPNLRFTDQNGDEVWLYQFYGKIIYIDWVAEWCGPCSTFAPYLEAYNATYGEDAIVLTVMHEDNDFAPGDAAAVARWTEEHGSTGPVLWVNEEDVDRMPVADFFPNIYLLDPKVRLAQTGVNNLFEDPWIEMVMDRMVLPIGGSLDSDAEVCDDGFDNDLDLIADCMDDVCSDDPICAVSEVTGALSPCTPAAEEEAEVLDIWQVEVTGAVARVETDTLAEDTLFESVLMVKADGADWSTLEIRGDDEWSCTYAPEDFGCARGWLRPGTWQVAIKAGTGESEEMDGDCADPEFGAYALRIFGDATVELLHDDVTRGDL